MDNYQHDNAPDRGDMADPNGPDLEPEYELRCLDDRDDDECSGPVRRYFNGDPEGKTWPRCTLHQNEREVRKSHSIERYANSDIAPSWFDPSAAGERWDDDY
jgi:hypothetical protein